VLSESTTTTSSAQDTDPMASAMLSSSFFAMITAEIFTGKIVAKILK
jgi:hypothetical protein